MLNRVVLMGRLTRDPELRRTQAGIAVTSFTLAVDRAYVAKGEERQADFFDVTCWRQTAEFTAKWFHKGQLVAVAGRLQQRKWQDKDGNNRISVEVVADEAHFAERKQDSPSGGEGYSVPPHADDTPPPQQPILNAPSSFAELEDDEDDLPF